MSSSFYSQIGIPSSSSTAIESSVQQAATSETNAAASATSSANSASAASASAVSANAADVSATQAKNDAETAATTALGYSQQASAHVSTSLTHANTASVHEQAALANRNSALQHANNASTFATNSSNSATASATSATNSATSATNSATSATASAASATSAAASLSTFQNQYLGASATAPTQDPDGSALDVGDLYFDTTTDTMKVYASGGWTNAGSSVNGTTERQTYTATAGQTTFAVTYDAGFVDVWLNGVKLLVGTDFTATSGTNIVLASGAAANDIVDIIAFGTFALSTHYTKTDADARFEPIDSAYTKAESDARYIQSGGSGSYSDSDVDAHLLTAGITLDATNNRLGVGTSSPSVLLDLESTAPTIRFTDSDASGTPECEISGAGGDITIRADRDNEKASSIIGFEVDGSEAMRIDSGNLLVGATAPTPGNGNTDTGHLLKGDGRLFVSSASNSQFNRNSDGDILTFRQSGNLVGSISSSSGKIAITLDPRSAATTGSGLLGGDGAIFPSDKTGAASDADVDFGGSSTRFKDLYLSSGIKTNGNTLDINSGTANVVASFESTDTEAQINLVDTTGSAQIRSRNDLRFYVNGGNTRAADIDSSGRLLVGKTSTTFSVSGIRLDPTGNAEFIRAGGVPLSVNRTNDDGKAIRVYQDGTEVGSLGANGGNLFVTGPSAGIKFGNASAFVPTDGNGANQDNTKDIGSSSVRFDDIFATNGTIQTSDEREKQNIASLTDAEITAAKAISKLFKTFKWNDSVTEKGDAARTHTGVIAQQVETAMSDAGLDAGNYAFFISTTWWETQTEVAAVEAVEAQDAVYDEEGNLVTEAVEAVEAQDAYTRTDTYDTQEEAPEGVTERTRMGIRYPELLSFTGAATEQRLSNIETRLEALEAN